MVMCPAKTDAVTITILAKAPIPGLAKTRLIPALGAHGAAALQEQLTERAVETAIASGLGPLMLWGAPDETHPSFGVLARRFALVLRRQPDGDLGRRMLAAIEAAGGPVLVIGTDCPALTFEHLRDAAAALHSNDAVAIPAEDGGYVLIGMNEPRPALFATMPWGAATVMAETRRRAATHGLSLHELPPLWDIDRPDDLDRLRAFDSLAVFA